MNEREIGSELKSEIFDSVKDNRNNFYIHKMKWNEYIINYCIEDLFVTFVLMII